MSDKSRVRTFTEKGQIFQREQISKQRKSAANKTLKTDLMYFNSYGK